MSDTATVKYVFASVTSDGHADVPALTISTINPDREGDRVVPEGGDFTNFMRNPCLMWAHGGRDGYSSVPIGTVTSLEVLPGKSVKAAWKWLENDPFADRIKNAWNQGVIRASSIGFRPKQVTPNGAGLDHEKWELLELSLCAIPMNPEAVRAIKGLLSLGDPAIDVRVTDLPELRSELDAMKAEMDALQKRGRVLSAVNESKLRAALTAISDATTILGDVLAQIVTQPAEDPAQVDAMPNPEDMPEEQCAVVLVAEDDPTVLRLTLAEDPADADTMVVRLVDDHGHEPTIAIDPDDAKRLIRDTLRAEVGQVLSAVVAESLNQALDAARGRVH